MATVSTISLYAALITTGLMAGIYLAFRLPCSFAEFALALG